MVDANGNFWPQNSNSISELLGERQGRKPQIRDSIMRAMLDFDGEPKPTEKPKEKSEKPGLLDKPIEPADGQYLF